MSCDLLAQDCMAADSKRLAAPMDEAAMSKKLDSPECTIRFVLRGAGKARVKFWTCDFTHDYVTINASYRT